MSDFDLKRFADAQEPVYERALGELRAGRKTSHWMWFVFPQLRGLGTSPMAQRFGIASLDEAQAYLAHALLGPRLAECTEAVLAVTVSLERLFGSPDDVKFISCMTLFSIAAAGHDDVFDRALGKFSGGRPDRRTLELLR